MMKAPLVLLVLLTLPSVVAADSRLAELKPEWRACTTDADCTVIHVNGCPWDSIAVARRHTEEVRAWTQRENMRHNCVREAVSEDVMRMMRAKCDTNRCIFASLTKNDK